MLLSNPDPFYLGSLLLSVVIAISVHEFAHALAADWLGDRTPRLDGRLTLDPRSHIDPLGAILFLLAGFGWGRPVLTNPRNFRTGFRTGMALVAAAGPFSNLVLAFITAQLLPSGLLARFVPWDWVTGFLKIFIELNVLLLIFNLLPVPPLDGFKVALGLLPDNVADMLAGIERTGPLLLMFLVLAGNLTQQYGFTPLGFLMTPAHDAVIQLLGLPDR